MTSPRTDARAAAERRAAAPSHLAAFEPDADAAPPATPRTARRRIAAPESSPAPAPVRADNDNRRFDSTPRRAKADDANRAEAPTPRIADIVAADAASSGPGWFGWMIAAVWFGLATGSPIAYWGLAPVLAQPPAFLAVLVALAVFPAVGLLMGVAAARDAAAARALAIRLAAKATAPAPASAAEWRIAVADAEDAAVAIADLLARERAAAADVATALKTQTEDAAQAARRQVGLMREASRLVSEETRAVEASLADALGAVSHAASTLRGDIEAAETLRTRMETTTDAAAETQRLLEETTATAFDAADAVRAAAQSAMEDARRAAEAMRAESEAARADMQAAVSALDHAAQRARADARTAAASDIVSFDAAPRPVPRRAAAMPAPAVAGATVLERAPRDAALARDLNLSWMAPAMSAGVDMLETMGVVLESTIAEMHFAAITRRARLGAGARRRAVMEAAPDAVDLIGRICDRDERVHRAAAAFRRNPGFDAAAPMEEWAVDRDVARAYLLVDAALG